MLELRIYSPFVLSWQHRNTMQFFFKLMSQWILTSLVQGPLTKSGFSTWNQRCWHWISDRSGKYPETMLQSNSPTASTTCLSLSSYKYGITKVDFTKPSMCKGSPWWSPSAELFILNIIKIGFPILVIKYPDKIETFPWKVSSFYPFSHWPL